MKDILLPIIFILKLSNISTGQQRAVTTDGKNVLLNDDGTWSFEEKVLPNNSASKPVFRKSSWDYSYEKVTGTEEIKILHEQESSGTKVVGYKSNDFNAFINRDLEKVNRQLQEEKTKFKLYKSSTV